MYTIYVCYICYHIYYMYAIYIYIYIHIHALIEMSIRAFIHVFLVLYFFGGQLLPQMFI